MRAGPVLEAMLSAPVKAGALFYGQTRRRQDVAFDAALRDLTRQVIADTRQMLASGVTPSATYAPKLCDRCSLIDVCQPRWLARRSIDAWLHRQLEDEED